MCCRVTRSDVTCVYFQHMHVTVDTETPHRHARTCEETNAPSRTNGAARNRACTLQQRWQKKKLTFEVWDLRFCTMLCSTSCLRLQACTRRCARRGEVVLEGRRDRRDMQSRPLILIRGLSSLLSAAAVDHTGVTFTINLNAQNH